MEMRQALPQIRVDGRHSFERDLNGTNPPDMLAVFGDGTIRRELARVRRVQNRHAQPARQEDVSAAYDA
jgi:hypothetical protein